MTGAKGLRGSHDGGQRAGTAIPRPVVVRRSDVVMPPHPHPPPDPPKALGLRCAGGQADRTLPMDVRMRRTFGVGVAVAGLTLRQRDRPFSKAQDRMPLGPGQPLDPPPPKQTHLGGWTGGGASIWSGRSVRIRLWPRLPRDCHRLLSIWPTRGASVECPANWCSSLDPTSAGHVSRPASSGLGVHAGQGSLPPRAA